jgi:transcriptional regulator with XRE-family HTH domain
MKRRLELKLTQNKASQWLGINPVTLLNWEKGKTIPPIPYLPVIHRFLGYDPYPPSTTTIGERLLARRRQEGWTQRHCADFLGVDPTTLGDWEKGDTILYRKHRRIVAQFLGILDAYIETAMSHRWATGHQRKGRS